MKTLIVGQGLAGTLMGYRLEKAGHTVHYVDAPEQTAASSVAAGIVNPITGRRFVKSWRIDELIPEAKALYTELEELLSVKLWHDLPLVRTLYNRGDVNDWEARSGDPGYYEYMDDAPDLGQIPEITTPAFSYAGVRHAARVDVDALVTGYRERLRQEGRFFPTAFDYTKVPTLLGAAPSSTSLVEGRDSSAGYVANAGAPPPPPTASVPQRGSEDQEAGFLPRYDYIICCAGWRARFNPWFNYLPHGGNKGEVLIVRTEAPVLARMFKHRVFLVPLADDTYWIGATSENKFITDSPTPANGTYLRDRLDEVLTAPYEIIDHRAAVRPTVRDRRLFLGRHPELLNLAIFNGLGTKGASLAPLGSRWLVEYLLEGKQLPEEVDIRRFQ